MTETVREPEVEERGLLRLVRHYRPNGTLSSVYVFTRGGDWLTELYPIEDGWRANVRVKSRGGIVHGQPMDFDAPLEQVVGLVLAISHYGET